MTDRVKGFIITLTEYIRIDDVQRIKDAVQMIKGVFDVTESICESDDHMNRMRVKSELQHHFYDFMKEVHQLQNLFFALTGKELELINESQ